MHRLTSVKEKSNLLDVRLGYIVKQKASFKEKAILWMSSEEHRQKILETEKQSFGVFFTDYCQTENIVQTSHRNIARKKPLFTGYLPLHTPICSELFNSCKTKKFNVDKGS